MNKKTFGKLKKDIAVICDYLGEEKKHYEESGRPRNHIWCYIRRTREWLKTVDKK